MDVSTTSRQMLAAQPLAYDSLVTLVVKLDESENGRECEKEKHRVEQDESRDAQPTDVYEIAPR